MRPALRLIRVLATLLLILGGVGTARATQYAVVVGIDTYQSPDITALRYAVRDAESLAATLKSIGFDRVFLLTESRPDSDLYPTRTNVIFRLEWVKNHVKSEDAVVFFFSGHGIEVDGQTFLLTKESDARSVGTLKQSACRAADVRELLDSMKVRHLLVVYDACRSNPKADRGMEDNRLSSGAARDLVLGKRPVADRVAATLFACSQGERSYEWHQQRHGFFTYHLVQGLKGAAGQNGKVTLQGLIQYVTEAVKRSADEAGYHQQPWMEASGTSLSNWILSAGSSVPSNGPAVSSHPPFAASVPPPTLAPPSLAGRWVGPWTNSMSETGNSVLTLVEDQYGNVTGDWDGVALIDARREGHVLRWRHINWDGRDYEAVFRLNPDGESARIEYTVIGRRKPQNYRGWSNVHRQ